MNASEINESAFVQVNNEGTWINDDASKCAYICKNQTKNLVTFLLLSAGGF